jgi:hypothetical protein
MYAVRVVVRLAPDICAPATPPIANMAASTVVTTIRILQDPIIATAKQTYQKHEHTERPLNLPQQGAQSMAGL